MAKKKDFTDESLAFLGEDPQESTEENNTELGKERMEVPEGYIMIPEPKTVHVHLLMQPTLKKRLKSEADQQGISVNEMIHRILIERYRG